MIHVHVSDDQHCKQTLSKPNTKMAIMAAGAGAFAEWVCIPEKHVTLIPDNISFDQAAAAPLVALTAWQACGMHASMRHARISWLSAKPRKLFLMQSMALSSAAQISCGPSRSQSHLLDRSAAQKPHMAVENQDTGAADCVHQACDSNSATQA